MVEAFPMQLRLSPCGVGTHCVAEALLVLPRDILSSFIKFFSVRGTFREPSVQLQDLPSTSHLATGAFVNICLLFVRPWYLTQLLSTFSAYDCPSSKFH